jgi:lysyl-tRNA synthetase class 2
MDTELLWERARIIRGVREFFDRRNYLETDTPLMAPDLIPESCLEVFETSYLPPRGSRQQEQKFWLIPSPEIWMKKLIARHGVNMYQICKCFRNTESRGNLHSPEFTMLEYYTMGANYLDSLALTEELFAHLADAAGDGGADTAVGAKILRPPFLRITMEEAFRRWAGFSLCERAAAGAEALAAEARRLGLEVPPGLDTGILYDLIFIHAVEPALPRDRVTAILDYPAFVPCLARKGKNTVERWELYAGAVELANCYSEETNPRQIRQYFEAEAAEKEQSALVHHKIDENYWENQLPPCSGTALGLDRLIMALWGKTSIDQVLPFP